MCHRNDAYGISMRPESSPDHLSLQIVLPGKGLIAFGAGPRCVDADRVKAPSVAAHCGFLVEDAEAAFLAGAILPELTVDFGGRRSSAVGGAPSQRMIASKPGRSCFFSSAVSWASIPRA